MGFEFKNSPSLPLPGALASMLRKNGIPSLVSGLGAASAIWILAVLTHTSAHAVLMAPFGASCVLLFALPQTPVAQPRNVVFGHFLSALMGLIVVSMLGNGTLAMGVGVGLAIVVMQFTNTLHPPAGGNPLLVILLGANWSFLVFPVLVGSLLLVFMAYLYHRFISKRTYPA